jgi:hypothetical protein
LTNRFLTPISPLARVAYAFFDIVNGMVEPETPPDGASKGDRRANPLPDAGWSGAGQARLITALARSGWDEGGVGSRRGAEAQWGFGRLVPQFGYSPLFKPVFFACIWKSKQ